MFVSFRVVMARSVALLACFCFLNAAQAAEADKAGVAATVNGQPISKRQIDSIMKLQAERGMPDNADTRKTVIENMALQQLAAQEALKKGLDKKPDVADQLDIARTSVLAQGFLEDYNKSNPIGDAALNAEYEKIKTNMGGKEFSARHILVAKEEDAKAIISKLKANPKQFAALAKAQSKDPGSKDKGGELGWFDAGTMVPEFSAAVAKLEKGKFTEQAVKSQFGYHVIQLDDTRVKAPPSLQEIKPRLAQQLQQQNLKKLLDDMKAKAKIEIVATAPAAAPATDAAPKKP
jgi:peptidyl-prolyl cis-trans isomerase C